jgi:hypothetical protein
VGERKLNQKKNFFFGVAGGWTQGLSLARQAGILQIEPNSHSPFFHAGYFWDKVSFYAQLNLDHDHPICASQYSWDDKCALPHPVFLLVEMRALW